ncbi:MAG: Abi family protein [Tyzzerella sp.]|nr:Abi family protein [Tyzzerella sp.]
MKQKIFLTYQQQIDKLKEEKNLTIPDSDYAKSVLKEISYYSLIGGYKNLFKSGPSGKFIHGVTFNELVSFYYFDEELRTLFLKYLLHVERRIKSMISYYFCEKYGESQTEYLNITNYTVSKKNIHDVNRLISSLNKTITLPSHYSYITHHATKYNNVPLWVATNAITFGQVSKLYQYLPNDIQSKISKEFEHISERQLHQFIRVLSSCRNVCAHSERLYSFAVKESIPDTVLHKKLKIQQKKGQYLLGKNDLFSVVIALRYLINNHEFTSFKKSLKKLIKTVLYNCPHLTETQLLSKMGFPSNWDSITRFKK